MKLPAAILALLTFSLTAWACPPGTTTGLQVVQASGATDSEASQNLQDQLAAFRRFPNYQVQSATTRVSGEKVYKTAEVTYCYPSR